MFFEVVVFDFGIFHLHDFGQEEGLHLSSELTNCCRNRLHRRRASVQGSGTAGAGVLPREATRHGLTLWATLPQERRPSSGMTRCPCSPLEPPATVTPGRLLVSPNGPEKDRLWGQVRILRVRASPYPQREGMTGTQPLHHDAVAGPRRVLVVVACGLLLCVVVCCCVCCCVLLCVVVVVVLLLLLLLWLFWLLLLLLFQCVHCTREYVLKRNVPSLHGTQPPCKSLRLIDGKSPGSQDPRRPSHPLVSDTDQKTLAMPGQRASDCYTQTARRSNVEFPSVDSAGKIAN